MPAKLVLNGDQIVLVYLTVKLTTMYITSCGIFRRILSRLYCRCLGLFNCRLLYVFKSIVVVLDVELQVEAKEMTLFLKEKIRIKITYY